MAEHDEVLQAGDSGEAAVAYGHAGRSSGDDGDGGDPRGDCRQGGYGVRVGTGLFGVRDDRGEGAVEVEGEDCAGGPRDDGFEAVSARRGHGVGIDDDTG